MDQLELGNMKWRYQLINYGTDEQPDLKLHEVYLDANTGKIHGWTERPYQISGYENRKDIVDDLKMILKAIESNAPLKLKDLEE